MRTLTLLLFLIAGVELIRLFIDVALLLERRSWRRMNRRIGGPVDETPKPRRRWPLSKTEWDGSFREGP